MVSYKALNTISKDEGMPSEVVLVCFLGSFIVI